MATHTITAVFDSEEHAREARNELLTTGLGEQDVRIVSHSLTRTSPDEDSERTLWDSIREFVIGDEDRPIYSESLRRGGHLLTARVDEAQTERAIDVLEHHQPIDLDERSQQWRAQGWDADTISPPASMSGYAAGAGPTTETVARELEQRANELDTADTSEDVTIRRRDLQRGTVRVRAYIVEVRGRPRSSGQ